MLNRDILIHECGLAQQAIELRYFPNKAGFLVLFLTNAITLHNGRAIIYTICTWLFLTLILRPPVVNSLRGTYIALFTSAIGAPLRWFTGIVCVGYIWFVTQGESWDGWVTLAVVFIVEVFITLRVETRQLMPYHFEKRVLSTLPLIFKWDVVKQYIAYMPITSVYRPRTPEDILSNLRVQTSYQADGDTRWANFFTKRPINEIWSVYDQSNIKNLSDAPSVFVVFDINRQVFSIGNSEWQGMVGDWQAVLSSLTEEQPYEIRVATLSRGDDLNAACWWLEQRLNSAIIMYNRAAVPAAQRRLEEVIRQIQKQPR